MAFVVLAYVAVQVGIVFRLHPFGPDGYLAYFEDDFFYYVVIVQHVLDTGRSSFDGITSTNGYHPLWFAVLLAVGLVFDPAGPAFFAAVLALVVSLSLAGYVGMRRLLSRRLGGFGWTETAAALYFFAAFRLARPGMETALVVGLAPFLLERLIRAHDAPRSLSIAGLGLFTSLVVLARLDVTILVGLVLPLLAWRWLRDDGAAVCLRRLLAFGLGGALLPAYLLLNLAVFGGVMPLSAAAKGLVTSPGFSTEFLDQLFRPTTLTTLIFPTLAAAAVAAALVLLVRPDVRRRVHPVLRLLLVFPVVYHGATALRSDWPIWPWYYYTIGLALPVAAAVVAGTLVTPVLRRLRATASLAPRLDLVCAALFLLVFAAYGAGRMALDRRPEPEPILATALRLRDFASSRPGVYAMGDRAGKIAYLLGRPLVQLEGLVADRRMLERIAAEADLKDVLREYGVAYYISTNLERDAAGCWLAVEPIKAGARAPKMRARLCADPVFVTTVRRDGFDATTRVFRTADLPPDARPRG